MDALAAIREQWLLRVEAEYGPAALTQHLGSWLLQLTVPFELVRLALAIVDDELAHAELSQIVYVAAAGREPARLSRHRLGLRAPPGEPLELGITRVCVEAFCLGETVAVRLFSHLRQGYVPRFDDFGIDARAAWQARLGA